jgi:chorismate lyase/3-hydroxybenzoate synthase
VRQASPPPVCLPRLLAPRGSPFAAGYLTAGELASFDRDHLLACMQFASETAVAGCMRVPLPQRGGSALIDVHHSPGRVCRGEAAGLAFACNDHVLFGELHLNEDGGLEDATYRAYRVLVAGVRAAGFPYLCRVWNFFPGINSDEHGLERYRAFCRGRHRALTQVFPAFEPSLPAASAIGTRVPGLHLFCIAANMPGRQVENPRQVSAFNYPRIYGPRSPSFSRSILQRWPSGAVHLFVSGTASIVGHATRYPGDFARQLDETCANLEALLAAANRHVATPLDFLTLRVYARTIASPEEVLRRVRRRFGDTTQVLILEGDICRRDLLVEIEGLAASPG